MSHNLIIPNTLLFCCKFSSIILSSLISELLLFILHLASRSQADDWQVMELSKLILLLLSYIRKTTISLGKTAFSMAP